MRSLLPAALLSLLLLAPQSAKGRPHPEAPLPAGVEGQPGLRFVDLNRDGHEDIVFSNAERHGVYLFNDVEKKNLGWTLGWPHIIREGKAGDAEALPLTTGSNVEFKDQAMWVDGKRFMSFAELCRPPAPAPLSPADSLKALRLKAGFKAELTAHEPLVTDPVFIDWDARGRMWVVEMGDYPFHEYQGRTRHGRVKVLEDVDDDGIYDKATTFLDDLAYPTGLAPWKNGVFIAAVPAVFYCEDTDGDGRADKRVKMLDGFKLGNPQHLVNGFAWGLDGWFYGGNGDSGGTVTDLSTGRRHDLSGRDFRFNPVTGEFQLQPGRAQYGRWRDDFGNWFANNNSNLGWHYLHDDRYLARNPRLAVPTLKRDLNRDGTLLYPASAPMRRFNQPGSVNLLTSACNLMPWRGGLLGPAYASSVFICEPANNLVHQEVLVPDGISFTSHRAEDEARSEFLASTDNWSRFTQARTGPDGCLHVVDFYRLVLEHPEWIPRQLIEHLDLFAGEDRGRIYRIRPAAAAPRAIPKLATLSDAQLGEKLADDNGWIRDTAQRLLIERGATWSSHELRGSAAAQLLQLWTMNTLGTLDTPTLLQAMRHTDARLREHAARLAEARLDDEPLLAGLLALAADADLRARVQAVFSLGESQDARLPAVLAAAGQRDAATPAMLTALLSAAPRHPDAATWQAALKRSARTAAAAAPPPVIHHFSPDRDRIVRQYIEAAGKASGDPARGRLLHTAVCAACHRLKGEGQDIGPELGTVAAKPDEQLIEAILDPNRAVEQRYLLQSVTLKNGKLIAGLLAEETSNTITLKLAGQTEVILRADIAKIESTNRSLMPDGLESTLTPAQLADLLAWIRAK